MSRYVELRAMSWYSFMEGASSTDEMLGRAHELGYDTLTLVDRNNITGALEFSEAAEELDIKPITGVTLMLSDDEDDPPSPITLLAQNRQGYANMCNLITFAHIAAGRTDPILYTRYLPSRTDGLIALIGEPGSHIANAASDGAMTLGDAMVERFIGWFGKENVFIELQRHLVYGDLERNHALATLAERNDIEIVATGGVCYHQRQRSRLHDVMTAIRHNLTLETSHRQRKANSHYELKSPERMAQLFREWPKAIENTRRIADRCESFNAKQINYRFPRETVPDEFSDEQDYLEHVCNEAAQRRYGHINDKVRSRLDREFNLIKRHGLAGFFLLYRRVISLAQDVAIELGHSSAEVPIEEKPPGRGRGSSVAMLVGTLIGLSHIDPLEYDLPLERFISEDELLNVPDIDLDFPRDIREALILRVFEEFGWDHAALTAMLPTYKLKGVVRDVGKVLGLPPLELDILAKRSESHNARNLASEMERIDELKDKINLPGWRDLIEIGAQLQGFPKGLAQHPGGMIISSTPLIDITPVQPSAMDGRYICQWDKHGADSAGFLKIDFLALGALSQMQECLQLIEKRTGSHIDLSRIDFKDDTVYDDLGRGDTVGVFQVESAAQMQTITRMKPRNLYDLALEVAAVRPGVGANDGVSEFIRRRNGSEWHYDHPLERRALEKSLGIILFQDQVVTLGVDIGGFTASEADQMRRAFQRRNNEALIQRYWERFRDGAAERGVSEKIAEKIFLKFNPHYMFPEGHALAFGVTAYHMAWLRRHYPTEFYTSIFNAQPMGFWPLETLKQDAKRMGVTIYSPDVNLSQAKCVPEEEHACVPECRGRFQTCPHCKGGIPPAEVPVATNHTQFTATARLLQRSPNVGAGFKPAHIAKGTAPSDSASHSYAASTPNRHKDHRQPRMERPLSIPLRPRLALRSPTRRTREPSQSRSLRPATRIHRPAASSLGSRTPLPSQRRTRSTPTRSHARHGPTQTRTRPRPHDIRIRDLGTMDRRTRHVHNARVSNRQPSLEQHPARRQIRRRTRHRSRQSPQTPTPTRKDGLHDTRRRIRHDTPSNPTPHLGQLPRRTPNAHNRRRRPNLPKKRHHEHHGPPSLAPNPRIHPTRNHPRHQPQLQITSPQK